MADRRLPKRRPSWERWREAGRDGKPWASSGGGECWIMKRRIGGKQSRKRGKEERRKGEEEERKGEERRKGREEEDSKKNGERRRGGEVKLGQAVR